jgi:ABC-type transport system involved in multi-copper enzyme maturation permease subunit
MRAYELMKETFFRKMYIYIVHLSWFAVYGLFFVLLEPEAEDFYQFLLIWAGLFLPLVLSAGIFGDDIASGRICVLATKPFWTGELYTYRLLGLSVQAAVHLVFAGGLLMIIHRLTGIGTIDDLASWLFSSWLLFNTWAAMSTSLSVVVKRAYNFVFLLVGFLFFCFLNSILSWSKPEDTMTHVVKAFVRYACPPFGLLTKLAQGEYAKYSLIVGKYSAIKAVACVTHTLVLTVFYGLVGVLVLSRRQFTCSHE